MVAIAALSKKRFATQQYIKVLFNTADIQNVHKTYIFLKRWMILCYLPVYRYLIYVLSMHFFSRLYQIFTYRPCRIRPLVKMESANIKTTLSS